MTTNDWTTWHLHLDTQAVSASDRVVTQVVRPLAQDCGRPWFFLRYWQGGPHVRLRIKGLSPAQQGQLEQQLADRLAEHGAARADEQPIEATGYSKQAGQHARGETGENRQVASLRPLGVYRESYEPELERYGGASVMAASEELFWRSSELVCRIVPVVAPAARRAVALRLTEAAAQSLGDQTERAIFYTIGMHSWSAWAESYGYPQATIDGVRSCAAAVPRRDEHQPMWTAGWAEDVAALTRRLRVDGNPVPGAVISSHVHMTHNRLGLSILEELRTYAMLSSWFPAPVDALPPLPVLPGR